CGSMLDRALGARAFPPTTFAIASHTPPVPSACVALLQSELGAGATALASHSSQSLTRGRRHRISHRLGPLPSNSSIAMPLNSFTIRIVRSSSALLSSRSATHTGLCWWVGREEKKRACTSGVVWRSKGSGWVGTGRDAGRDQMKRVTDYEAPYAVICGRRGKGASAFHGRFGSAQARYGYWI
ncbi:hypothetical protein B0H14DRAFT_2696708, partial [Mycena olivaceomarginata]